METMTNQRSEAAFMRWEGLAVPHLRKWLRKMSNFVLDPYVDGPRAWGYL